VKTVLIPQENVKDLQDIPDNVKAGLEIIPVGSVDEVLGHALVSPLTPIEWTEPAPLLRPSDDAGDDQVLTH
jgi:ATP-dependent Lon protease